MACDMIFSFVQVRKSFNEIFLLLDVDKSDFSHYVQMELISICVGTRFCEDSVGFDEVL